MWPTRCGKWAEWESAFVRLARAAVRNASGVPFQPLAESKEPQSEDPQSEDPKAKTPKAKNPKQRTPALRPGFFVK
jgi:hypothetical protein